MPAHTSVIPCCTVPQSNTVYLAEELQFSLLAVRGKYLLLHLGVDILQQDHHELDFRELDLEIKGYGFDCLLIDPLRTQKKE